MLENRSTRPLVVVDATPLDSALHRLRGIGRYVQGLLAGLAAMRGAGPELDGLALRTLRLARRRTDAGTAPPGPFETVEIERRARARASSMHFENRLRLDRWLPTGTDLYHATGPEGVCNSVPFVATCHDLIPLLMAHEYMPGYGPADLARRAFWMSYERVLRRKAAAVIAISEHVAQTLRDRFRVPDAKITVIHHGLDDFWRAEPVPADGARIADVADAPFVLSVGGFDPRKGIDKLVAAIAELEPADRVRLVVAGARHASPILDRAEAVIAAANLDVHFLDYVSDAELRWLYRKCDLLAFSSREEGWGLPILEAMAQSAPVVCAGWGAMAEAAGGAAYTTDVTDPHALAAAIARVRADDDLRARLCGAGPGRAGRFAWKDTALQTVGLYRDVLSRR